MTNDRRAYFIEFEEGKSPPEVKFDFEYNRSEEIPQLRSLKMDMMKHCVHLMTMSTSTQSYMTNHSATSSSSYHYISNHSKSNFTMKMTKATTKKPKTTIMPRTTKMTTMKSGNQGEKEKLFNRWRCFMN